MDVNWFLAKTLDSACKFQSYWMFMQQIIFAINMLNLFYLILCKKYHKIDKIN